MESSLLVHQELLRSRCHLLKWAFFPDEDEGDCIGFSVACGTPEFFGVILQWIYTNGIHRLKDASEVLLYIDVTIQAFALGIWDLLDPLCDRIEEFHKHNSVDRNVISAMKTLPNKSKLQMALISLTASDICKSLRNRRLYHLMSLTRSSLQVASGGPSCQNARSAGDL